MTDKQNNKEQQQQTDGSISIPREYVLEGVKDVLASMHKMLDDAKRKYGHRYNWKNEYEECLRRFNLDNPEDTLKEYDLIMAKQSKLPSTVRGVIRQIGENAFRYAIKKHLNEQQKKSGEENTNT
jgi:hypothetical protein